MAGCQVSEEEAVEAAKNIFINSFSPEEIAEANFEAAQVDFYLPSGMEVTEEIEFNLQLEKNDQIFLMFFIPIEPWDSDVHLKRDQEFEKDAIIFEEFQEADKLGYLAISPNEEGSYKVIVGIGGAKMTTIATVADLAESTEIMTEILHSVQYKNES